LSIRNVRSAGQRSVVPVPLFDLILMEALRQNTTGSAVSRRSDPTPVQRAKA
jgi:hypothetical protein